MRTTKFFLTTIFLIALALRLWWFPQNTYFGYDQARDAYESQVIYKKGDLKIIGPSTSLEGLYHGPFYWYLIGPAYIVGGGNPTIPAFLISVINSTGVFLIFLIGKKISGKKVGLIAAFLYAVSYEQTQYSLYFGNPAPVVVSIMLFYLGFLYFGLERKWWGLLLAVIGLGLSIQFQFFLVYLSIISLVLSMIFIKNFKTFNLKRTLLLVLTGVLSFSSFILADIKYGARSFRILLNIAQGEGAAKNFAKLWSNYLDRLEIHFGHNIFSIDGHGPRLLIAILVIASVFLWVKRKKPRPVLAVLLLWVFSSALLIFLGGHNLYYSNIGISAGILLLTSFLMVNLLKNKLVITLILIGISLSSWKLIQKNSVGPINDIYVQEGMLLKEEKAILEYIYKTSNGKPIVVAASTMPLKINTTWSYLFEWYGKSKYGYLPYWAGEAAPGYPGNLTPWRSQVQDYTMFAIVEPSRGVRQAFIDGFLKEQEQYGKVIEEKQFGEKPGTHFLVQRRR